LDGAPSRPPAPQAIGKHRRPARGSGYAMGGMRPLERFGIARADDEKAFAVLRGPEIGRVQDGRMAFVTQALKLALDYIQGTGSALFPDNGMFAPVPTGRAKGICRFGG